MKLQAPSSKLQARDEGFTLIELLIVIGIIGFLAASVLVAVDPVKRIQDARDARRYSEANALLNAILNKQVDDRALYNGTTQTIDANDATSQVIVSAVGTVDCDTPATAPLCPDDGALTLDVTNGTLCVANLSALAPDYIAALPIDPLGSGTTPSAGNLALGTSNTGYYINRNAGNRVTIGACYGEQTSTISVQR